ncbi:Threonine dehydrogenase [Caldanaerobius fijiensis DSM 17918]|uniref:Threonine dehydrogenase n=1 Tax=Caldanaerobius fijiensis DSM 17918 TaxID=1121256 RepID=A0A1M4UFG3_9THEO|nr:zinc-binding dehydrogenase [Caldanaerobius fijiensis]SHE55531.1 Threonine dehydrogenase [Caldanaerobius fijiensis DSM 17918]
MEIDEKEISSLVEKVLRELRIGNIKSISDAVMDFSNSTADRSKFAKVAMLVAPKKIEIREYLIPEIGDDDILVKVEGCGVCGTDVHEWRGDPFGIAPVVLGHEGTGEIIAIGKNVKYDTAGKKVAVGDKIVTSVIACGQCPMCLKYPENPNLCENQRIYGLIPDSEDNHLNGWFATHIKIGKGSTFFNVSELNLEQRLLIEPSTVAVHAVERAKKTGLLKFNSIALVQGVGPIGQLVVACLKVSGIRNIIAIDGNDGRLEMAKRMGATATINFTKYNNLDAKVNRVKELTGGIGADFVFQCTGVPAAASEAFKYVRRGGGLCEVGFFVNNGETTINPHFDICNKEINLIGSWTYNPQEYLISIEFIKRAKEIGIPLEQLITHRFSLEDIDKAMETNISLSGIKVAIVN